MTNIDLAGVATAPDDAARDDLSAARGVIAGMLISAVMWAGVGLIVLAVLS